MISAKELFSVSAIGGYAGAGKAEETLGHVLFIDCFIFWQGIQIAVNLLNDLVLFKQCSCNKQRLLQIYLILFVIAMIGKFCITA